MWVAPPEAEGAPIRSDPHRRGGWSAVGALTYADRPRPFPVARRPPVGGGPRRGAPVTVHDRPFGRYFEDFAVGDVYRHWPGKTITEYDDHLFCMITMNHHPTHTNNWFAENESPMKQPLVVGNLVYSLVLGMSVPDVSGAAIANLEVETLQHRKPTFHGDTIYAVTKVIDKRESQSKPDRGVVTVESKGINQRDEEVCFFRRKVLVWKRDHAPGRRYPYGDEVFGQ
jgi:acyl dehydratase